MYRQLASHTKINLDEPLVSASIALRYHYDAYGRVVGRTLDPGGASSVTALDGSTEEAQFEKDGNGKH
jgi:hypothetical protein